MNNTNTGKKGVTAVILDWAGTSVDFGSIAPTRTFINVFARRGIRLLPEEVRSPMGLAKRDHVKALLAIPAVAGQWKEKFGADAGESDVDSVYAELAPELAKTAPAFSVPIRGAVEFLAAMRSRGIKIGSTTGYVAKMMEGIVPKARELGFSPDCIVVPDDVPAARPAPWMIFENMRRLGVSRSNSVVKIGDTVADMQEGKNAGTWTIGLTLSGNEVGLSEEEFMKLSPAKVAEKRDRAQRKLRAAGAHYTADGIADCERIIDEISARVRRGETP